MQQRQLRLGDILDDYCPRERRVTNHAIVAMVDQDVKQTRCTTCDAEHEYKHARVPRQRRKTEPAALYAQALAGAPKRVAHDPDAGPDGVEGTAEEPRTDAPSLAAAENEPEAPAAESDGERDVQPPAGDEEEGPIHRRLIRATLPRPEGQTPTRQLPEFTIRQPGGRPNRFRPRHGGGRGAQMFHGRNNGNAGGGPMRSGGGARPVGGGRPGGPHNRQRSGRKRSK